MKYLSLFIALLFYINSYSQSSNVFPTGLGIEIGAGYNQLKHQAIPIEPFFTSNSLTRDEFKLTPTLRISWEKEIAYNFSVMPFVGYSITGGKLAKRFDGYEDEYSFRTLDFGLLASYRLYAVSFSIGGKYNRFLKVTQRYILPDLYSQGWEESEMDSFFKKFSFDLGGRTSYTMFKFTIALEAWFSITDLENKSIDEYVDVSSNRVQILIGYRL